MKNDDGLIARKRRVLLQDLRRSALSTVLNLGFDRITVEDIAESLGISRRTFFRYFESKEDVILGTVSDFGDILAAVIQVADAEESHGLEFLKSVVLVAVGRHESFEETGRPFHSLIFSVPSLKAKYLVMIEHWADQLSNAFERGNGNNDLSTLMSRVVLTLLVDSIGRWIRSADTPIQVSVEQAFFDFSSIAKIS